MRRRTFSSCYCGPSIPTVISPPFWRTPSVTVLAPTADGATFAVKPKLKSVPHGWPKSVMRPGPAFGTVHAIDVDVTVDTQSLEASRSTSWNVRFVTDAPAGSGTENERMRRVKSWFIRAYSYRHWPPPRSVARTASVRLPSAWPIFWLSALGPGVTGFTQVSSTAPLASVVESGNVQVVPENVGVVWR